MLDVLKWRGLPKKVKTSTFLTIDCRSKERGSCSLYINGRPHGPFTGLRPVRHSYACSFLWWGQFHHDRTLAEQSFSSIKDFRWWTVQACWLESFKLVDMSLKYRRCYQDARFDDSNSQSGRIADELRLMQQTCIGCGCCVATACKNASSYASRSPSAKISQWPLRATRKSERKKPCRRRW